MAVQQQHHTAKHHAYTMTMDLHVVRALRLHCRWKSTCIKPDCSMDNIGDHFEIMLKADLLEV
jgi:hypothetical protein